MRRSKNSSAEQQARGNFTPPQRAVAEPVDVPAADPPAASGGLAARLAPRNWRVPTRLNAILLLPVLVGLVMGGLQVKSSIDTWGEAQDAERTARVVRAAAQYGAALLNERDLTARPLLTATTPEERRSDEVKRAYAATDAAKAAFDRTVKDMPSGQGLERRLTLFRSEEPRLKELREAAYTTSLDPVRTEEGYVQVQHSLMEFGNELGLGTGNVTSYGRMVYAIQLAKAAESLQRSIGMHLLVRPSDKPDVFQKQTIAFNSYNYLEQIAIAEFASGGTQADVDRLQSVMNVRAAEDEKKLQETGANPPKENESVFTGMARRIGTGTAPKDLAKQDITPETWMAVATNRFEGYRQVEQELMDGAVREASAIASDARRDAFVNGAITVVALLVAFVLGGAAARQMSRSMQRLRTAAFGVAEQRLPMLVDQLSRTEPGRVDTRVEPIPIDSRDEIGEVARAFDQVHREAVRLAAEQAMLRGNVNAIFTNLSRRNQSLIEGQLTLITELENSEADPDQLASLFRLDHLATRMRRNGENLLILAGEDPGSRWDQPIPLVDVLRAASSEVESYERIELSGVPETDIHGRAVTDLVHLLAELLENATTFSSPQTKVRVTATRLPDGRVMVEIHDKGIGLTPEDFADINHKLANPPVVDAAVSQRMGLFVVGRLADRHGIRVQLRPSGEQAGTTSLVMLPEPITRGGGGEGQADGGLSDFTVSQIIPEQESFSAGPVRTAAELGFDDSRYEAHQGSPRPGAVNRSLKRGERRAALEAQTHHGARPGPAPQGPAGQGGQGGPGGQDTQGFPSVGSGQGVPSGQSVQSGPGAPGYGQPGQGAPFGEQFPAGQGFPGPSGQQPYPGPQGGYAQGPAHPGADAYTAHTAADGYTGYPTGPEGRAPFGPAGAGVLPAGPSAAVGLPGTDGYTEDSFQAVQPGGSPYGDAYVHQPHQGDWTEQTSYPSAFEPIFQPEPEAAPTHLDGPGNGPERVGFDRPGQSPGSGHELTGAGLPRRGSPKAPQQPREQWRQPVEEAPRSDRSEALGDTRSSAESSAERAANDERWQRAEKLREPKAGGVTSSGLPRRVPKANLIEGAAEQTAQRGPQVSRAPEDVRGRLSNLRRGVQRGRSAGVDTNGPGFDPGSTYNQER
ncbi:sensor histidine kinase [Streptomyces clavuligerus]|uniref:sensor histidine kinase n=1 Tax=Streptomyces clavuligerus TaxID=1901 RepID=UPI00020D945A|nr:nitrate- and nitrite sensing domain-containing protein [Streptomyces clavuligerus]ANW17887.1 histidine kinase [Streptomyces clavuligerus]AXU12441.1 HAMP domain-containing protein [Streptomyces clavuligerus]MBY6302331.1 nitrate- and nitrite sensing domain-containing protein [Streptomyces clavuligerus]QCS05223.1 HAMP domain-containing protein [Streptomyces clavuligerus]QPJ95406.1 HAMP domain-containing protein [Streptomyces clavuligerus]